MPNSGEFLSQNSERDFPFRMSLVPNDFIVDLRVFLSAFQQIDIFFSEVSYDESADTYMLTFSSAEGIELTGTVERRNGVDSRVFQKTILGSGEKVALFTPGASWDNPSWGGEGDWTVNYTAEESSVEPCVVLPGPATFRRLVIEGSDPFDGNYPLDTTQRLMAGYNMRMSAQVDILGGSENVEIEAGPELGLGFPPPEDLPHYVRTINGVGANEHGKFSLAAFDCLRLTTPIFEGAPLEGTLELNSDCSVCCSCSKYQEMSDSLTALSSEVATLCTLLNAIQTDAITAYEIGKGHIELHGRQETDPDVICRDPVLRESVLTFSVQNRAKYPAYVYVAIAVGGISNTGMSVVAPSSAISVPQIGEQPLDQVIHFDGGSLTPLDYVSGGGNSFPSNITDQSFAFTVRLGYPGNEGDPLLPVPAGGSCLVQVSLPSVPATGATVVLRTISRFGSLLKFGSVGHIINAEVTNIYGDVSLQVTS